MKDRMEGTGQNRRAAPRGEFGQAKKQIAAPADFLA